MMDRARLRVLLLALIVRWACSDEPADESESADVGEEGSDHPLREPTPPNFLPCPDGWREVPARTEDGLVTCDPWPAGWQQECPPGETHFPGETGCRPVGAACPTGTWADGLEDELDVLYVRPGSAPRGAGTRDAPLATVAQALAEAGSDTVIALAKGVYDESLILDAPVRLVGACAPETVLAPTQAWEPPEGFPERDSIAGLRGVVTVESAGVVLENLAIDAAWPGLVIQSEGVATVNGLAIQDARLGACLVIGGELRAEDLSVRDTVLADEDPTSLGFGLAVVGGGQVWIEQASFSDNVGAHLVALGPGVVLELSRAALSRARPRFVRGYDGNALVADVNARIALEQVTIEANPGIAVALLQADDDTGADAPSLRLTDIVIRGPWKAESYALPMGMELRDRARVEGRRVRFDQVRGVAIRMRGQATLSLEDALVEQTQPFGTLGFAEIGGLGLWSSSDGESVLERVWFLDNAGMSLWLAHHGGDRLATIRATDVLIARTTGMACGQTCPGAPYGIGAVVEGDSTLVMSRFAVRDNAMAGIMVANEALLELSQGEIAGHPVGISLQNAEPAATQFTDVLFRDNQVDLAATPSPVPDSRFFPRDVFSTPTPQE